jgi:hypothetical protein
MVQPALQVAMRDFSYELTAAQPCPATWNSRNPTPRSNVGRMWDQIAPKPSLGLAFPWRFCPGQCVRGVFRL